VVLTTPNGMKYTYPCGKRASAGPPGSPWPGPATKSGRTLAQAKVCRVNQTDDTSAIENTERYQRCARLGCPLGPEEKLKSTVFDVDD